MKYRNRTHSLTRHILQNRGMAKPLCNDCATKDCTHTIETKKVSIIGITKTWRVLMKGDEPSFVYSCDGFSV
jgi:hypothetical protein